jgi:hypothetical protein
VRYKNLLAFPRLNVDRLSKISLFAGLLGASIYLTLAWYVLATGHPHEDAYILFKYSENWAAGNGITYNAGGDPVEGATDFLWMAAIALFNNIGFSSGFASGLLNAAAVGFLSSLLMHICNLSNDVGARLTVAFLVPLLVATMPFSLAGLAGFSAPVFAAATVGLLILYLSSPDWQVLMPFAALLTGFLRPDGLIIGVGFWGLSLFRIWNKTRIRNQFFLFTLGAGVMGISYFAWRYFYFGHLLPLPLMVKSRAPSGFDPGNWLYTGMPYPPIALAGVILAFLHNDDNRKTWRILYASLPFALHVAALTTAHRSQNVQERFYAPEIAAILAVSMLFLQYSYQTTKWATWVSIVVIACLLTFAGQADATKEFVANLQGRDKGKFSKSAYINVFPEMLDAATPDSTVVALTEAGRMAYWLEGHHIDLVGLNTPATAVDPVTPGFIERKNPDLLFINTAGMLARFRQDKGDFFKVKDEKAVFDKVRSTNWRNIESPVSRASSAVLEFLRRHQEGRYTIYLAQYQGAYKHLYAIREGGSVRESAFRQALRKSYRKKNQKSYLEMVPQ